MAKVTLLLDTREKSKIKGDRYPLVLRIGHQSTSRTIGLDKYLKPEQFNESTHELKGITNSVRHTKRIQKTLSDIDLWLDENKAEIKLWTINKLKDQIEKQFFNKQSELTLLGFSAKYLYRLHKEGRYSTASSYEDALKAFVKYKMQLTGKNDRVTIKSLFNKNKEALSKAGINAFILLDDYQAFDVPIKGLDVEFMKDFKAYMMERFSSRNTVGIFLRSINAILNDAGTSFADLKDHKPLENIKKGSFANETNPLSIEELQKLREVELNPSSPAHRARLYFLFMFNNMGMNFYDVALIKRMQFDGERIKYFRNKTKYEGDFFSVKQSLEALNTINHFLKEQHDPEDYLFPILSKDIAPERIFRVKNDKIKWFNKHIKTVAKEAGINKNMTSYTARDTWSNIGLDMGIDIRKISAGLGHSSVEVTENSYSAKIQERILDDINAVITNTIKPL